MTAAERQNLLMATLCEERRGTINWFAAACKCNARTIRRDIDALSASGYPVETVQGNGGGVFLAEWYHPHSRTLCLEQLKTLIQIKPLLNHHQQIVVQSIINQFGPVR